MLEKLRRFHRAKPFRPFTLHLSDGRKIEVQHPELMAVSPGDNTVIVVWPQTDLQIVALSLVTGIRKKRDRPRAS